MFGDFLKENKLIDLPSGQQIFLSVLSYAPGLEGFLEL